MVSGGRPNIHDRANQPQVRFRTDEKTKEQLHKIAESEGKSLNEFMEELIKREINRRILEKK